MQLFENPFSIGKTFSFVLSVSFANPDPLIDDGEIISPLEEGLIVAGLVEEDPTKMLGPTERSIGPSVYMSDCVRSTLEAVVDKVVVAAGIKVFDAGALTESEDDCD